MTDQPKNAVGTKDAPMPVPRIEEGPNVAERAPELWRRRRITNKATGAWVIDLETKSERMKTAEMFEDTHRAAEERGRRMQGRIPQIEAITPRGERRQVAAHLEGTLGAKGFRPAVYYGKTRRHRVERWTDGLLYRECPDGSFECMGVCCIGTPVIPCQNEKCERCNTPDCGHPIAHREARPVSFPMDDGTTLTVNKETCLDCEAST